MNEIATRTSAAPIIAVPIAARTTVAHSPGQPSANGVTATVIPGSVAASATTPREEKDADDRGRHEAECHHPGPAAPEGEPATEQGMPAKNSRTGSA